MRKKVFLFGRTWQGLWLAGLVLVIIIPPSNLTAPCTLHPFGGEWSATMEEQTVKA